jgi:hypothetical protein
MKSLKHKAWVEEASVGQKRYVQLGGIESEVPVDHLKSEKSPNITQILSLISTTGIFIYSLYSHHLKPLLFHLWFMA